MDPLSLLGRAVAVFLLLGITLWLIRRTDGLKKLRRSETPLEVLGSARLGKGASVALVRIGDADYALGVTDQAVSLLTEAELGDEPEPATAEAGPTRPGVPAALQAQLGLLRRRGHGSRVDRPQVPEVTPEAPTAAAAGESPAGMDARGDSDFALLLAAATAPVTPVQEPEADAVGSPATTRPPRSARVREAAGAPVPATPGSSAGTARPTGARGARGPRARAAAAGTATAAAGATRTGQRRAARTRTTGRDTSAAA